MNYPLSERINNMSESATLAMAAKARELKSKGVDIISLSLGEPDFKTPKHIQEAAKAAIDSEKYFAYPPVTGYQDLREAIANKLQKENGIPSSAEQIVVSNGAKQSIANIMLAMLNPGDEVVVFAPYWVSYVELIKLAEGTPVMITGTLENDFKPTAEQLKAAITDKTKAILYSSPCNPTGGVFTEKEMKEIADVVKEHDIMVIADEIYEHINFTEEGHFSMASLPDMAERTITVNGFSKGFAMTGWRVGYISAPLAIAKAASKVQGQITSGNCSIAQRAALAAITEDLQPTKDMTAVYHKRRDMVIDMLNDIEGVKTYVPKGAFYIFPDVSYFFGKSDGQHTITDANDLAMHILNEASVSTVTGDAFGAPNCIRLSYAASDNELVEAIKRMKAVLNKLK
ncbi:pyridoxal phosphate-dependent aminotransferase [Marivirga atlantica]|jgi:aspartate aminotransferase|uniref:Aminotransferase n=1 Tax=Marivirga atlantica TaxID=1548457 RepID=A0A937AD41_9BACT|nr:pyridoxal phosphate-dependent aminotransferase [Marivirga atlantica]MBL0764354.1 pyridoxal phosphate-dependent aminotransferase [Marivirga atlantica]